MNRNIELLSELQRSRTVRLPVGRVVDKHGSEA